MTAGGTRWQYTEGVANPESVPPKSYTLDTALLERPGNKEIQLDLFLNYVSNVKLYPQFQEYFRKSQPLLAIWGKNDPFFIPAGAEAFRRDLPGAKVQFLDTGHFAIETHVAEIASAMKDFLNANTIATGRIFANQEARPFQLSKTATITGSKRGISKIRVIEYQMPEPHTKREAFARAMKAPSEDLGQALEN